MAQHTNPSLYRGSRFLTASIGSKMSRWHLRINTAHSVTATSSAMGKANHTAFTLPVRLSSQAAGTSTTSWRITETDSASVPRPSAWNAEEEITLNPAIGKWMAIMRKARIPMASMVGLALNTPSSTCGKTSARIRPHSIMHSAKQTASLMVWVMRLGWRAP